MEELELTYLVRELPEGVLRSPSKELLDIYLPADAAHPILRIRKAGDQYEITKKEPIDAQDASRQLETTIPLTADEFKELETIPGRRVAKTRYYYQEGDISYEIDAFRDDLSGLVLADKERKPRDHSIRGFSFEVLAKRKKPQKCGSCLRFIVDKRVGWWGEVL